MAVSKDNALTEAQLLRELIAEIEAEPVQSRGESSGKQIALDVLRRRLNEAAVTVLGKDENT